MANWPIEKLGDLAEISAGNSAPQDEVLFKNGAHPFIRTSDVGKIRFGEIDASIDRLNEAGIKGLRKFLRGTILLPKSGASTFLNHRVIMSIDGYVSSHLATVKARPSKVLDKFLLYYLSIVQAQSLIQDHAYPSLRLSDLENIDVPVPTLDEQKRIVAILDEAFAGIAAATANAEKNLANARTLVDVAIEEQLSRISQGQHQETTVAQLAEDRKNSIRTGPFGSQLLHGEFVDEGIAVLGIDNVVQNQFRWDKRRYITPNKFQELARYKVLPGDVLISIMGTCGRCAVVPGDISLAINSKHLCCISLDQSRCLPEFLKLYFLHHPVAKNYLDERASGAIMAGLNMGIIKDLPVLLPCVKEQAVIAGTCERLSRGLSDLTELYSRKRANLADLKQAILQKAFSGELSGIKTRHCEAA